MFDFPSNPALNDTYTSGGISYQYNGYGWLPVSSNAVPLPVSLGGTGATTGAAGPYLPIVAGSGNALTGMLRIATPSGVALSTYPTNPADMMNDQLFAGHLHAADFACNAYYSSSITNWKYINAGAASVIGMTSGEVAVYTIPSGAAGAAATITQRLRIASNLANFATGLVRLSAPPESPSGQSTLQFYRSGAAADRKTWELFSQADDHFSLRITNDAYSLASTAFTVYRNAGWAGIQGTTFGGYISANTVHGRSLNTDNTLATVGHVGLQSGNTANVGYVQWYKTDGTTRMGYMGWNPTNIELRLEAGATFMVTNGPVYVDNGGIYTAAGNAFWARNGANSVTMVHDGTNAHINSNGGNLYLNHYTTGTVYMAQGTCFASNVGELYATRSLSCGSYIWVNGAQWSNNSGWMYSPNSINSAGDICSNGVLRTGGTGGPYWQSSGGWMYCPNGVNSAGNVRANNDLECQNVVRNPWGKGAKIETVGWDYDWLGHFISAGTLYMTPDKATGFYYNGGVWPSDASLKKNIRDSEIDALGLIMATPVRAFQFTEDGLKRLGHGAPQRTDVNIGLVAQELERNIPEAVFVAAFEHASKLIDSTSLIPYLFRAVQQLAEQNAVLVARIAQLEQTHGS